MKMQCNNNLVLERFEERVLNGVSNANLSLLILLHFV